MALFVSIFVNSILSSSADVSILGSVLQPINKRMIPNVNSVLYQCIIISPVSNSNDMRLVHTNPMKFLFLIAYIEVLPVRFVACEVRHFVQLSLFVVQRFGTFVLLVCFLFAAQIVQNLPVHSLNLQSFV